MTWSKPVYDGGDEITGYIVEYAEAGKDEEEAEAVDWMKCSMPTHFLLTEYTVGGLMENKKYKIK